MYDTHLEHSGVKGMKWGVRRYQNSDGSLTPMGRSHYGVGPARRVKTAISKTLSKVKKGAGKATSRVSKSVKNIKAKTEERRVKKLNQAILEGNVNRIVKNAGKMSNAELNDALNRARMIKNLKDLGVPKEKMTTKIQNVIGVIDKGAKAAKNISEARSKHLAFKKEREQYERDEDNRIKEERKKWKEEHPYDEAVDNIMSLARKRDMYDLGSKLSGVSSKAADKLHDVVAGAKGKASGALSKKLSQWKDEYQDDRETMARMARERQAKSGNFKESFEALSKIADDIKEENERKLKKRGYM